MELEMRPQNEEFRKTTNERISDELKNHLKETIEKLRANGIEIKKYLITKYCKVDMKRLLKENGLKRKKLIESRSGSAESILFFMVAIFAIALLFITTSYIFRALIPELKEKAMDEGGNIIVNNTLDKITVALNIFDYAFIIAFMLLFVGSIYYAVYQPVSPMYFWMFVIILILAMVISPMLSNAYEQIKTTSAFAEEATHYPMQNKVLDLLPVIVAVLGLIVIVVLYSKMSSGGAPQAI